MKPVQVFGALAGGMLVYAALAARIGSTGSADSAQPVLDPVPAAFAENSGNRLKAKFIRGADGSELFTPEVLHDSELDVDCEFWLAADGKTRCLPTLDAASVSMYYSDPECTDGVVFIEPPPTGCESVPPPYVYTSEEPAAYCERSAEAWRRHVYPIGELIARPSPLYRIGPTSGECETTSSSTTRLAYTVGAEIPASRFIEGTAAVDP